MAKRGRRKERWKRGRKREEEKREGGRTRGRERGTREEIKVMTLADSSLSSDPLDLPIHRTGCDEHHMITSFLLEITLVEVMQTPEAEVSVGRERTINIHGIQLGNKRGKE